MKCVKINIILNKNLAKSVVDDLYALGIHQLFMEVGRSSLLNVNAGFTNILKRHNLVSYPV